MKKPNYKSLTCILFAILAGLIIYLVFILPLQKKYYANHVDIHGTYLLNPIKIETFSWLDQNNKPFTQENLQNHWSLLFFGFTHCDLVCPVTLSSLNQFYQNIEKKLLPKDRPQIIFVTIDPERDTTERLKTYLAQFNRHFMGARTSAENMPAVKKQFHILSEKDPKRTGQYNHSTELLLINPRGEIQAYFAFPHDPSQLEKNYLAILQLNQ